MFLFILEYSRCLYAQIVGNGCNGKDKRKFGCPVLSWNLQSRPLTPLQMTPLRQNTITDLCFLYGSTGSCAIHRKSCMGLFFISNLWRFSDFALYAHWEGIIYGKRVGGGPLRICPQGKPILRISLASPSGEQKTPFAKNVDPKKSVIVFYFCSIEVFLNSCNTYSPYRISAKQTFDIWLKHWSELVE